MEDFGVVALLQILGGLLVLNALLSYWCTGSATWRYTGRWLDPRFHAHWFRHSLNMSLAELALYNGSDAALPIYIAINGSVFDVTRSPHLYGPGGPYAFFAGRDAARAFVTGCFSKPDEFTHDLRGLDPLEAAAQVQGWTEFFSGGKYWRVGSVHHTPLPATPPAPCEHVRFPGKA